MMIMAYDKNGVIATDRVPPGSTVTAAYYRKFLQDVCVQRFAINVCHVRSRCPHLHDNERLHASGAVSEILEKYGWQVLPHPPYSPDMSSPHFDLFPKLKKPLRGKRFRSTEKVYWGDPSYQTHQQRRRPDRNTRLAQTLDRCDKAHWRLHWRPV